MYQEEVNQELNSQIPWGGQTAQTEIDLINNRPSTCGGCLDLLLTFLLFGITIMEIPIVLDMEDFMILFSTVLFGILMGGFAGWGGFDPFYSPFSYYGGFYNPYGFGFGFGNRWGNRWGNRFNRWNRFG